MGGLPRPEWRRRSSASPGSSNCGSAGRRSAPRRSTRSTSRARAGKRPALTAGDHLKSSDGRWVPVESVAGTNEDVTVYNLRIEEYHTYFVGCAEWGFSVWRINLCLLPLGDAIGGAGEGGPAWAARRARFSLSWTARS